MSGTCVNDHFTDTSEKSLLANFIVGPKLACTGTVDHATISLAVEKSQLNEPQQAILCCVVEEKGSMSA